MLSAATLVTFKVPLSLVLLPLAITLLIPLLLLEEEVVVAVRVLQVLRCLPRLLSEVLLLFSVLDSLLPLTFKLPLSLSLLMSFETPTLCSFVFLFTYT